MGGCCCTYGRGQAGSCLEALLYLAENYLQALGTFWLPPEVRHSSWSPQRSILPTITSQRFRLKGISAPGSQKTDRRPRAAECRMRHEGFTSSPPRLPFLRVPQLNPLYINTFGCLATVLKPTVIWGTKVRCGHRPAPSMERWALVLHIMFVVPCSLSDSSLAQWNERNRRWLNSRIPFPFLRVAPEACPPPQPDGASSAPPPSPYLDGVNRNDHIFHRLFSHLCSHSSTPDVTQEVEVFSQIVFALWECAQMGVVLTAFLVHTLTGEAD